MKIIKLLVFIIIIFSLLSAQEIDESLIYKVKSMSANLLQGYSQPLVTAFGTGMGTGLFHSAYTHDFLGFDLARTNYTKCCYLADLELFLDVL